MLTGSKRRVRLTLTDVLGDRWTTRCVPALKPEIQGNRVAAFTQTVGMVKTFRLFLCEDTVVHYLKDKIFSS